MGAHRGGSLCEFWMALIVRKFARRSKVGKLCCRKIKSFLPQDESADTADPAP